MAQYFIFRFTNPINQRDTRFVMYANDATDAHTRMRQWLGANPFNLGATDQQDFLRTWDTTSHSATPSNTPPPPEAGDWHLNYPSGGGGTPPGGGGNYDGPGLGTELQNESPFAAYIRGLQLSGRPSGANTIAGRYARENDVYQPYLATSRFKDIYGGGADSTPFEEYTRTRGIGDVRREAGDLFQRARGQPNVGDINLGEPDENQAGLINQLALAALSQKVSPLTQRMFGVGNSLFRSRDDFLADREQGVGQNYLEYVRNRLGLQLAGL